MEYRHPDDDAWYDVNLFLVGEALTLNYANFSEDCNETFQVDFFKNMEAVKDFKKRFRPSSVQLQDHECSSKIVEGRMVCGYFTFENNELKFYDATIDEILNEKHTFEKGEEVCCCKYVLRWLHGPLQGRKTFATISDICVTPPPGAGADYKRLDDLQLAAFLEMAARRLENASSEQSEDKGHEEPNRLARRSEVLDGIYTGIIGRRRTIKSAFRTNEGRLRGKCKKTRRS